LGAWSCPKVIFPFWNFSKGKPNPKMNVNSTEATSGPRMGVVEGFHDDQFTSSNYPFGMSEDEFERRSVVYETYYTLHYSRPILIAIMEVVDLTLPFA
jgi:hypothetical protein